MEKDYQREHETAKDAAEYAETVPGWLRMSVVHEDNGKYLLTFEWDEVWTENGVEAKGR